MAAGTLLLGPNWPQQNTKSSFAISSVCAGEMRSANAPRGIQITRAGMAAVPTEWDAIGRWGTLLPLARALAHLQRAPSPGADVSRGGPSPGADVVPLVHGVRYYY